LVSTIGIISGTAHQGGIHTSSEQPTGSNR
jgi:hypothetical protein